MILKHISRIVFSIYTV